MIEIIIPIILLICSLAYLTWISWVYIKNTEMTQCTITYDLWWETMSKLRHDWSVEYGKVLAIKLSRNSSKFKGYTDADIVLQEILDPAEDKEILFEGGLIMLLDLPAIFGFNEETNEIILKESASKDMLYLWLTQLYFRDIRVKVLEDALKLQN